MTVPTTMEAILCALPLVLALSGCVGEAASDPRPTWQRGLDWTPTGETVDYENWTTTTLGVGVSCEHSVGGGQSHYWPVGDGEENRTAVIVQRIQIDVAFDLPTASAGIVLTDPEGNELAREETFPMNVEGPLPSGVYDVGLIGCTGGDAQVTVNATAFLVFG